LFLHGVLEKASGESERFAREALGVWTGGVDGFWAGDPFSGDDDDDLSAACDFAGALRAQTISPYALWAGFDLVADAGDFFLPVILGFGG